MIVRVEQAFGPAWGCGRAPGFGWDETAGLAERAMMLSAAHSKCKLRRPANEEEYQRKRIGVEAETGSDRRGGLGGPIQPLLCVKRRGRGLGRRACADQRGGVSAALGSRTAAAYRVMETATHSPWISRLL